jgi:hypothetical protein
MSAGNQPRTPLIPERCASSHSGRKKHRRSATSNHIPCTEIGRPPCRRRRPNKWSRPRTTPNSYTRPQQDTTRDKLHGFAGVEGATNTEADRNPGEIYSKKLSWSCLVSIAARKHVPHAAIKAMDHLPLHDARSIIDKKENQPPTGSTTNSSPASEENAVEAGESSRGLMPWRHRRRHHATVAPESVSCCRHHLGQGTAEEHGEGPAEARPRSFHVASPSSLVRDDQAEKRRSTLHQQCTVIPTTPTNSMHVLDREVVIS